MKQGTLGDCYLLATLVAFDARPGALERLWYTDKINSAGIYAMKFRIAGEERLVYVDDNLPVRYGNLTFAHSSVKGELWQALAEKIWAKLVGSYSAAEAGNAQWVLKYITNDPVQGFNPRNMNSSQRLGLWNDMKRWSEKEYLVFAGTDPSTNPNLWVGRHAYTVLSA